MMLVYFAYTYYFPGDENIIQDSTILTSTDEVLFDDIVSTPQLYAPYPNPSKDYTNIHFLLAKKETVKISIYDINGKMVWIENNLAEKNAGYHSVMVPLNGFANGLYTISLETENYKRTKKLLVE